jgi:hypothetical protein
MIPRGRPFALGLYVKRRALLSERLPSSWGRTEGAVNNRLVILRGAKRLRNHKFWAWRHSRTGPLAGSSSGTPCPSGIHIGCGKLYSHRYRRWTFHPDLYFREFFPVRGRGVSGRFRFSGAVKRPQHRPPRVLAPFFGARRGEFGQSPWSVVQGSKAPIQTRRRSVFPFAK